MGFARRWRMSFFGSDSNARVKRAIFIVAKNLLRAGDTIDKVVMVTGLRTCGQ